MRQRQPLLRARHADVAEPPLLLEPCSSIERECGKIPSSIPIMKTARNSSPFALWSVISVTRLALAADRVLVGEERDLLEEAGERRLLGLLPVLPGDADELLQVLDPALRLDRPLGLERVEVAAALEHALERARAP